MNYRELLKQYLDDLDVRKINAVAGLFLISFADWLQRNAYAADNPPTCSHCGGKDWHHTVDCYLEDEAPFFAEEHK
ncbi:MAG: hypothetical protein WC714_28840 [Candidatus Obscuribacterales bacterium]|jgi:hypothetical protein